MAHTATSEGFPAIAASAALQSALAGLDVSLDEELERYSTWRDRGRIAVDTMYRPPTRTAYRPEPTVDLPLRLTNPSPPPADEPTEPLEAPTVSTAPPVPPESPDAPPEEASPPADHPLAGLWTPAGIASFGLLAAASFTLGWFLLDPAGLGRFLQPSAPPPSEGNLPQSLSEPADPTVQVPVVQEPLPTGFVPLPGLGDRPGQSQTAFTRPPSPVVPAVGVTENKTGVPPRPSLRELDLPPVPANAPPVEPAQRAFGARVEPVFPQAPDPEPIVTRPRRLPEPEPVVARPRRLPEPVVIEPPAPRPRTLARPPAALPSRSPVVPTAPDPLNAVPAAATALPPAPQWAPPVGLAVTPPPANPVRYAEPIAPAPTPTYTIVAPSSFANQARQVEQDAFVRPQDGQVQLGAYRDPMVAQQRIAELRSQGIPAELR